MVAPQADNINIKVNVIACGVLLCIDLIVICVPN